MGEGDLETREAFFPNMEDKKRPGNSKAETK